LIDTKKSRKIINFKFLQMMMKNSFSFLLIFLVLSSLEAFAQRPQLTMKTPRFDSLSQKFVIEYAIQDPKKRIYEYSINLYYDQGEGKERVGPLQALEGHWGDEILAGKPDTLNPKIIYWDFLKEDPSFDGLNTEFKLDVKYQPSVMELGRMEQMWRSVLLPGWGNTKVRRRKNFKWRWHLTYLSTFGLIAGGIALHNEGDGLYQQYLNSDNNISRSDEKYTQANTARFFGNALIGGAIAIWVTDIVRVGLKGRKNKKAQEKLLEKNRILDENTSQISFSFGQTFDTPTFGMVLKF